MRKDPLDDSELDELITLKIFLDQIAWDFTQTKMQLPSTN